MPKLSKNLYLEAYRIERSLATGAGMWDKWAQGKGTWQLIAGQSSLKVNRTSQWVTQIHKKITQCLRHSGIVRPQCDSGMGGYYYLYHSGLMGTHRESFLLGNVNSGREGKR